MKQSARWLVLASISSSVVLLTVALLVAIPTPSAAQAPTLRQAQDKVPETPDQYDWETLAAKLEPELAKTLTQAAPDERLDVIVELRQQIEPGAFLADQPADLSDARRSMVSAMQSTAQDTQASLRVYLASRWLLGEIKSARPFWIFNGLAVSGARADLVYALAARPDVALVRLDHFRHWIDFPEAGSGWRVAGGEHNAPSPSPLAPRPSPLAPLSSLPWGVQRIQADRVWNSLGISGTGVVVANVDSGVDWLHPALQANYRGYSPKGFHQHEGNWYDATPAGALYPLDGHGHGSHTMGTIAGQEGLGVAPGAQWIAVRAFDNNGRAADSWIHAAFEWLLAPGGDPDLAPQVINNSWGNNIGTITEFANDVEALQAAGIFVVFSAGNNGPTPRTVGSPASNPVSFAVGASDEDDEIADFSSRGPSPWDEVRPHVVAPGVNVYSALPGGVYGEKLGTSMAAPHASGAVALMLSAQPGLSITRTAYILTSTARSLGDAIPNNNTGYGLIDAYAAVALAANAGLISGTISSQGQPLAGATIQATPSQDAGGSALAGRATNSDASGRYQLFLGAGHYDLTISAFAYAPVQIHALAVITGATTTRDLNLTPLPSGQLQGTVTALDGETVSATMSVLGTPVSTTANGGNYALTLPGGDYTLEARALGYRVLTASVSVAAGQVSQQHFVLSDTMRVLLVDSGPRYYNSQVNYYRQALDDLRYAYDVKRIKHLPDATLTFTTLQPYDLLVWSAPTDSPGMVGAASALSAYLLNGGNLLLSGQDVAFWDGGGGWYSPYYLELLYSAYQSDNAPSRQVVCLDDSAVGGITLTIEGSGGADNQRYPDVIKVLDSDHASLACNYQAGGGAIIQAGFCAPQRVLNLGFGFEAINAASDRAAFMGRALDWFNTPRQTSGLELSPQTDVVQVAPAGSSVTHTVRLRNLGEVGESDRLRVELGGDDWPSSLSASTYDLSPCATSLIELGVQIPLTASWNDLDAVTLTVYSSISAALSQTVVITSKTPSPVLLVDDDRWYDQEQIYVEALNAADAPYDYWDVKSKGYFGTGSPPSDVLARYPIVLWFTAYDWYDPIHSSELPRLANYLDNGGRLFLSSQDYLRHLGNTTFTHDYLGVIGYSDELTQTSVHGVPGHVLGAGLGPDELDYPFPNWSNSVLPAPGSQLALQGQHGQAGALTKQGFNWRTAFFTFPFEALPPATRATLMSRLAGWLSWLGQSELQAERAAARVGDTVGYTLTLRNDGPDAIVGAAVSNALPPGTALAAGPVGGASVVNGRITWSGDLSPGQALTFTYRLSLTGGTAASAIHNSANITVGAQAIHFQRQASVRIAAPNLAASNLIMTPTNARASAPVQVKLTLRNDGLDDAPNVYVDNPLPWPLRLLTGTLSSGGVGATTELLTHNRVRWTGAISAGKLVTLTYLAIAPPVLHESTWVYNAARLEDGLGGAWERGAWLYVTPQHIYLPLMHKEPAP